jgi:hypothetical protein
MIKLTTAVFAATTQLNFERTHEREKNKHMITNANSMLVLSLAAIRSRGGATNNSASTKPKVSLSMIP